LRTARPAPRRPAATPNQKSFDFTTPAQPAPSHPSAPAQSEPRDEQVLEGANPARALFGFDDDLLDPSAR
jgi:hypothetical protein